jgi:hypothetical protein
MQQAHEVEQASPGLQLDREIEVLAASALPAPEPNPQVAGAMSPSDRRDRFALGLAFWKLISGSDPLAANCKTELCPRLEKM